MATKEENHYRNLAEVYQISYNNMIEVAEACMTIQGVVVSMYSDLMIYKKKNGKNDIYQRSENRLKILLDKTKLLSTIQSDNYTLKLVNRRLLKQVDDLERELKEQHRQDALIYKIENDFNLPVTPETI